MVRKLYLTDSLFLNVVEVNNMAAWTSVKSTSLVSQYAIAIMHSNLWPGAHAFAVDRYVAVLI